MKLTDQEAIKALKKVRIYELEEMIDNYPEDERDGRTDWDMIANEAGWLLSYFNESEHAYNDALNDARECIRRTKGGKVMPLNIYTLKPAYKDFEVRDAKDLINEYNRLTRFVNKLKGMGLYCPYC